MSSEMRPDESATEEGSTKSKKGGKRPHKGGAMAKLRRHVSQRDPMEVILFEMRLQAAATFGVLLAMLLWIISVSTDFWFHVTAMGGPLFINRTNSYFVRSHSGLWTICKYIIYNDSISGPIVKMCHNHRLFPSSEQIQTNPEIDSTILDYTRTETAFAIITFCLMTMGLAFSLYTFKEQRYTFKRLAGGVHFISGIAILVVIEVNVNSVNYEERYLTARHPKGAIWSYGYSFILACFSFVFMILAGCTFIFCSRKKKGDRATGLGAGEDEPHILGRI